MSRALEIRKDWLPWARGWQARDEAETDWMESTQVAASTQTYAHRMRFLLNVIWLLLSGIWLALGYAAFGIIMCLLIVTIPFGIASFRLAAFVIWPFGRVVVRRPTAGVGSALGNVLWFILCGIWMAIAHLATGIALCLTIIGIPLGLGNFKLIPISLAPLGKDIVAADAPYAFVSG